MDLFQISIFVVVFLLLVCNVLILGEMFSLKKRGCDCATDEWRRIFIMVATLFLIAAFFISLARNFIHPTIFSVWSIILMVVGLMNIVVTRQFIMRLNDEECKCATERSVFKLMNFLNWAQIILLVVAIVILVSTLLFARKVVVNEIRKRR